MRERVPPAENTTRTLAQSLPFDLAPETTSIMNSAGCRAGGRASAIGHRTQPGRAQETDVVVRVRLDAVASKVLLHLGAVLAEVAEVAAEGPFGVSLSGGR